MPLFELNPDPLDFIEVDLVAGAVIELGCLGAFVVGDPLGVLDGAAFFEVGGDAGGPEGMAADGFGQADGVGTAFNHIECVAGIERSAGQRPVPVNRAEEGAFLLDGDACGGEIGIDVIGGCNANDRISASRRPPETGAVFPALSRQETRSANLGFLCLGSVPASSRLVSFETCVPSQSWPLHCLLGEARPPYLAIR